MIASEVVASIKRLLGEGAFSHREIARVVGVNRQTVGIISRGQRPDYEALREARKSRLPQKHGTSAQRCPECHASVYLPCVACNTQRKMPHQSMLQRILTDFEHPEEPLGLDLKERHQQRYQRIHASRLHATAAANLGESRKIDGIDNDIDLRRIGELLEVVRQKRPTRTRKSMSLAKEMESCFQWRGAPGQTLLPRHQRPHPATTLPKAEVQQ